MAIGSALGNSACCVFRANLEGFQNNAGVTFTLREFAAPLQVKRGIGRPAGAQLAVILSSLQIVL